ncbi:MAG: phytanoyl-CoA dioxygenase family protein [Deltaproteobacteria bacterium]|nr:phytanoyl-CoA dioxygenase family protein [Deltaproteobacteria bacterium]
MSPRAELLERGFTVFPGVLSEAEVSAFRAIADRLVAAQSEEDRRAHRALGSLISIWRAPELAELITHPGAREIFSALGYPAPCFSGGYLLSKPLGPTPTFWHQDWCFWDDPSSEELDPPQIGLLYYLTPTSAGDGALRCLPGSQRTRHALHDRLEAADLKSLRRVDDPGDALFGSVAGEVAVGVRAGSAIAMDARLLHAAHPNRSARARPLITLWYFPRWERLAEATRAFLGAPEPLEDWPSAPRERVRAMMRRYEGGAAPATPTERGPRLR